jgi:hypothetical protein
MGFIGTHMEYEADSIIDAHTFLDTQNVTAQRFYIEVYTPEGGIGKDCNGTYEFDVDEQVSEKPAKSLKKSSKDMVKTADEL